jgi:predicted nucleotidyltransferase
MSEVPRIPTGPISRESIDRAAQTLLRHAPPGSEVILFGSYARGTPGPRSDVDFLVVEPAPIDRHAEMIRLRNALGDLGVPVDALVTSRAVFDAWKTGVNSVIARAHREGKRYA